MLPLIDDYILARAAEMAATDGDVLQTVYIVGAVNVLQAELFAARERILAAPPVPMIVAGAEHASQNVPPPQVEADGLVAAIEGEPSDAVANEAKKPRKAKAPAPDATVDLAPSA